MTHPKLLLLDIENSPNLAHVWGLWQQNVSLDQLQASASVLCWCAKWVGTNEYFFADCTGKTKKQMLKPIWKLLNEADAVIHYNGLYHDIPLLNKEFLEVGILPPSPYKQIDLLQVVRKTFKFPSNKLEYVCRALGVGEKIKTIGHELWTRCMAGDKHAWLMMQEYNINDVKILEEVYNKVLPWIKGHANYGLYTDNKYVCPNCGGHHYQKRGYAYTHSNKYQRFQCLGCGKWFRDNKAENRPGKKFVDIS